MSRIGNAGVPTWQDKVRALDFVRKVLDSCGAAQERRPPTTGVGVLGSAVNRGC
jgi:hypothetical protein